MCVYADVCVYVTVCMCACSCVSVCLCIYIRVSECMRQVYCTVYDARIIPTHLYYCIMARISRRWQLTRKWNWRRNGSEEVSWHLQFFKWYIRTCLINYALVGMDYRNLLYFYSEVFVWNIIVIFAKLTTLLKYFDILKNLLCKKFSWFLNLKFIL